MGYNWVDSLYQLLVLVFIILIPITITILAINFVRRYEKRANERLQIDKEHHSFQKNQLQSLHEMKDRVTKIETILKQVH